MDAILRTAAETFARKGYDGSTIEDIANQLKVTKASIYYYVDSKEELLFLAHRTAMEMVRSRLAAIIASDAPAETKFALAIKNHVMVLIDEWSVATMLLQQEQALSPDRRQEIVELRDSYEHMVLDLLEQAVAEGKLVCEDPVIVLKAIFGAINWVPHWYRRSGLLSKETIADLICRYLMGGLTQQQPGRQEHAERASLPIDARLVTGSGGDGSIGAPVRPER